MHICNGTETIIKEFGDNMIKIPHNIVSNSQKLSDFVDEIYPSLEKKCDDFSFMINSVILTPRNTDVDDINNIALDKMPGITSDLESLNFVSNEDDAIAYQLEFLHTLCPSEMPPHI